MEKRSIVLIIALAAAAAGISPAFAQDTQKGIRQYREALQEDNPAELWEARGEALWKTARGPNKASLERCDLGLGPGVVKGAYAKLPRYFADTDRVMDLETRLVHCMVALQGFPYAQATRRVFGGPAGESDLEALVAYVAGQSRGARMEVPASHPKEREAYALGEKLFFYRGGSHDFACASCHGENGRRIRLQDLPNLSNPVDARRSYTTWPAYRVSQGELRSFQWRLNDCFRQQRFPQLIFGSPASIALTVYVARNANGGVVAAPGIKR